MGLFTGLLGLPVAPLRGTIWIAEEVLRQAEDAYYDPGVIRRQLEDIAQMREDGLMSDAEAAWWEEELISRMIEGTQRERE